MRPALYHISASYCWHGGIERISWEDYFFSRCDFSPHINYSVIGLRYHLFEACCVHDFRPACQLALGIDAATATTWKREEKKGVYNPSPLSFWVTSKGERKNERKERCRIKRTSRMMMTRRRRRRMTRRSLRKERRRRKSKNLLRHQVRGMMCPEVEDERKKEACLPY